MMAALLERARPRRALAAVLREARHRPWRTAFALGTLILDAVVGLIPAVAIGQIVDALSGSSSLSAAGIAMALLAAGAVLSGVLAWASAALTAQVAEPLVGALRERALASALRSDASRIEHAGSGDLTARLTADIDRLSDAASDAIASFVAAGLAIVTTSIGLVALDARFALAALVAVPVQVLTLRWYLRRSAPVYRAAREAESAREQRLLDVFQGCAAIRALSEDQRRLALLAEASGQAVAREREAVALSTRFSGRLNVAEYLGLAVVLVVGLLLVGSESATLGAVTTAALFFTRLFGPINTLLGLFDTVQQAGASLTRVVGVIDLPTTPLAPIMRGPGAASVRVSGVDVVYPNGRTALRGVELEIRPGERVALVGASGSGKSTLARVIAGFIQPERGRVEATGGHGAPMLIEQRGHLFAGTLADDLRLVAPEADDLALEAAAEQAGMNLGHEPFTHGLDTALDSPGMTPADAGRVALARLVLADPAVAVLDEASADAGGQARELEELVDRLLQGRTSLVVAHRLPQAVTADRVVLLEDGIVVADGSHDDLLRHEVRYRSLWDAWTGGHGDRVAR